MDMFDEYVLTRVEIDQDGAIKAENLRVTFNDQDERVEDAQEISGTELNTRKES